MTKLCEDFKDFPDDQKPPITKMGLTMNVEMVQCTLGEVAVGSPLSYQCPLPTSRDYMPYANPPPLPPLPGLLYSLEPVSVLPTLSSKEQEHLNAMIISWEEAHSLEVSTRVNKKAVEKSLKMRLTSRFSEIAKLKSGRSHVEHLLFKIKKDNPKSKTLSFQVEEELKPEALWEYCRHLCVNWSPCGLVVHPNAPWLGVIPDGVVYDPKEKHNYGLVYTKYVDVQSIVECNFLLCQNGVVQLKRNHRYYWQIQGQLMVTSMSWCDLLVYSRKDMLVQRIYRNELVIKDLKNKLEEFFFYFYLPNLD